MSEHKPAPAETDFDRNPPIEVGLYDESIRMFNAAYDQLFPMAHACLRSIIGDDARLLVVGAGTGKEICTFGPRSPGWHFTGVDPSAEMLAIARKKIDAARLADRVTLQNCYVHDLRTGCRFDAATCILVMHFLRDDGSKLRLLKSIADRLEPGAPLVLVDDFGDRSSAEFKIMLQAWKTFVLAEGANQAVVEYAIDELIMKQLHYVPEERIEELLVEAGFGRTTQFFAGFLYGGWIAIRA